MHLHFLEESISARKIPRGTEREGRKEKFDADDGERKTRATGSNVIKYSWTIFRNGRQELRWNSVGIACTIRPGNRAVLFIPQLFTS